ncbi:polysaccharide export protein [Novosphingobium indicum]|uniref:Polysaccharide export protein n=1 Tax=Novosphingobium indicum TaxID=462949 RepID=A0ABQ2JP59_9SPHN|nr:polysaccharide biosynthesis/export family protein [Novosphingobium indicum]GGN53019.1 polysaccharide export protein [Novosphingobium indicum]|tara:strand:- start:1070 stop:1618 length:549 start_codon:yes stop_codon:yes gene_type:complete
MLFRTIGLVGCALLMGCASTASMTLPSASIVEYRLSRGDRLKLDVFREDTISGEYVISDQGTIGLPMVGDVQAAGKTLAQLRTELAATLRKEYVRDARINLDVVSYRPIYILGEVQKPGEYGYSDRMTVHALVAKAGGFTYRANEKVVYIRHVDDAEESAYKLTSGATVLPGDTVRIDQRYF